MAKGTLSTYYRCSCCEWGKVITGETTSHDLGMGFIPDEASNLEINDHYYIQHGMNR